MAVFHGTAVPSPRPNRDLQQLPLFSLIAELCAPRQSLVDPSALRLIVDSRLPWAARRVDHERSWLYLPDTVRIRRVAGCLIISAD